MRRLRKGTPEGGDVARPDSFSYTPVLHGLKNTFTGWLAGDTYWCEEAHEHKPPHLIGSQPCVHWMTNGELKCARCRKQPQVKVLGWCPLWREQDHKAIIVIVHKNAADHLRGLGFGEFVTVGRVDAVSSIFVRSALPKLVMRTDNEYRKRAVDITDDLLSMWKLPELNEWLRRGAAPTSEKKVSSNEVELRQSNGEEFGPMYRNAAARYGGSNESDSAGIGDASNRIFNRAKDAEKNGKHNTEGGAK